MFLQTHGFRIALGTAALNRAMHFLNSTILVAVAVSGVLSAQAINLQITTTSPLPPATVGVPYPFTFQASGTTLPLSWFIPAIPAGLSFDESSGKLSGTPTTIGTYTLHVNVVALSGPENPVANADGVFTLVAGTPGTIGVSPRVLTFNAIAGGEQPPFQPISVLVASGNQSSFTVAVDGGVTGTTAPWLGVLPAAGGASPGRLIVAVDSTKVPAAAATFNGRIRVLGAGSTTPIDVAVTLNLTVAPPKLSVSPASIRFNRVNPEQILVVRNAGGGGPLNFDATVTISNPYFTSVSPTTGQTPAVLRVVNEGTGGEFARNSIHIETSAGNADIPVSKFVPPRAALVVNPIGSHFQISQGSGTSLRKDFRIVALDAGRHNTYGWTAELVQGSDWLAFFNNQSLTISKISGSVGNGQQGKFQVRTLPGAAMETPGGHYALIKVSASLLYSPVYIVVVSDVTASAPPAPDPITGGLFFFGAASGDQPVVQTLEVGTSSAAPVKVAVAASTVDGGKWLTVNAVNDTASSAQTAQFTVSTNTTGLKRGVYHGEIDMAIQNELRVENITLVVAPTGTTLSQSSKVRGAACVPSQLALTETGIVNNFSIPTGRPATLEMQLNDDCGAPVLDGNVVASFSNGDPPITLQGDDQMGLYSATWQPGTAGSSVAVTLDAVSVSLPPASAQIAGGVTANATPGPSLAINGLLNNLNPILGASLAPGTVSQVYGTGLASSPGAPSSVPLPTLFKGVQVLVGGINAPIFYTSPTQLNIQIPSELTAVNEYQALIAVNGAYTLPQPVDVVPVAPGVVAFADGAVVAQHASDSSLVDANKPAKPNEVLTIYLVGLGATSVNVPSGTASPGGPLALVNEPVTVTIDGQPVQTSFVGLTPGGVGLYQINLTVPANARAGKLPVTITQAGIAANATTLLVQP